MFTLPKVCKKTSPGMSECKSASASDDNLVPDNELQYHTSIMLLQYPHILNIRLQVTEIE